MVADIARATLALYRHSAVTVPASANATGAQANIVAHELIRTNFDIFERAIERIANHPVRLLQSYSKNTSILKARRVHDRAIGFAIRNGRSRVATGSEALAAPKLVGSLGGQWIPGIQETRRRETTDIYEHRAILGFIRWLDAKLARIFADLSRTSSEELSAITRQVYRDRISRWRSRLAATMRRSVFTGIAAETSLYATSIFRLHPQYASAFSAMSRMRAGLSTAKFIAPAVPIDRTYQLYELWCYVGLLAAVSERFPISRKKIADILKACVSPTLLGFTLSRGDDTEIPLDDHRQITYQRRISTTPSRDGARTLVVDAVPDVCISQRSTTGLCEALVILDPKYRSGASLKDGIRDMHVYRDAILDSGGNRLVKAAVALSPRPSGLPPFPGNFPLDRPSIMALLPASDPNTFSRLLDVSLKALDERAKQTR
jgi:hypothetical protein